MLMLLLVAIGGVEGSVRVNDRDTVDDLRLAITEKNPKTIKCDAKDVHFFLAKRMECGLPSDDPDVIKMRD
ncbi:hypothetical protein PI124_g6599 [Phytophthora idaei]|nr:hypothetical protein PI124_g6599 [Phytophthora idaei]